MGLLENLGLRSDWQPTAANLVPLSGFNTETGFLQMEEAQRQQQAFAAALAAQGGMGNQREALAAYQALARQMQGNIGAQQGVLGQQQGLADQLALQAQGGGPNPALAQLALTTGQNIGQQAALMAGQRGGRNAGLISRQAAEQGGAIQQQAGGQAAIMRAQQQLAAQQALAGQQGMMGQTLGQIGQGQMNVGQINTGFGNLASQQVAQQQQALALQNQLALAKQSMGLEAIGQYNQQLAGMQGNLNLTRAGIEGANVGAMGQIVGGIAQGAGTAIGAGMGGGAHGGIVQSQNRIAPMNSTNAFISTLSRGGMVNGMPQVQGDSSMNDTVMARLSPGEVVIPRTKVNDEEKIAAFLNGLLGINLKVGGRRANSK